MVIPISEVCDQEIARIRCQRDLLYNSQTDDYINEKGYKQKLIEILYKLGYYKDNESVFLRKGKNNA